MPVEADPDSDLLSRTDELSVAFKQATRDKVFTRADRPVLNERTAPSPSPAPDVVLANPIDPGSGFTLNEDNPGNTDILITYQFSGTNSQQTALEKCADSAWKSPNRYYSWQLYYDSTPGLDKWFCVVYSDRNTDASYFNVPNSYAAPVFGLRQM
ncbi:hypothetical protein IAT40_005660 [Kwoniella sp. CBS 6097]